MLSRLLPRETSFFDHFDRHVALTLQGVREFVALAAGEGAIAERVKRIKEIEHETDVITHQCVEALHKTFITPIGRDSIHRLISRMDDIMDFVEAASERISLYEIREMTPELRDFASVLLRACEQLATALHGLRDLKRRGDAIVAACIEVNRLENEADAVLRTAVARLFREEKDAIAIIKWKEIYEALEEATDRCEDVANIIEGVVLEHS
jgi:uncharacterized protein Yka (UPF0111/DUF47 family)